MRNLTRQIPLEPKKPAEEAPRPPHLDHEGGAHPETLGTWIGPPTYSSGSLRTHLWKKRLPGIGLHAGETGSCDRSRRTRDIEPPKRRQWIQRSTPVDVKKVTTDAVHKRIGRATVLQTTLQRSLTTVIVFHVKHSRVRAEQVLKGTNGGNADNRGAGHAHRRRRRARDRRDRSRSRSRSRGRSKNKPYWRRGSGAHPVRIARRRRNRRADASRSTRGSYAPKPFPPPSPHVLQTR